MDLFKKYFLNDFSEKYAKMVVVVGVPAA